MTLKMLKFMSPVKQGLQSSEPRLHNHPVLPSSGVVFVLFCGKFVCGKSLCRFYRCLIFEVFDGKWKGNLKVFLGTFALNPTLAARWQGYSLTVAFQHSILALAQLGRVGLLVEVWFPSNLFGAVDVVSIDVVQVQEWRLGVDLLP